jgi:hypothetical protein
MNPEPQVFRSKVDRWLLLVVAGGLMVMWLAPIRRLWAGRPVDALDAIIPMLVTAFMVWIFRTTSYVITGDVLVVRAGPVRRTIPLREVQRLRATHNPLSSPALSLDRIEVTYGARPRRVLISPEDKRGFVTAVLNWAPTAVVDGLQRG